MMGFKASFAAALCCLLSVSAQAIENVDDAILSEVIAQDGVTIGGDLNINIASFKWTDTDLNGGSVSFNGISITGMFVQTVDVINGETIVQETINAMKQYVPASRAIREANKLLYDTYDAFGNSTGIPIFDPTDGGSDVVQFAFPNAGMDARLTPTIKIASIKNGNSDKSYGSLEIRNINMQGSKFWLWPH